tara:strand:+ start:433 stop:693 length:261 start_codon:yes stop_codon:yes gene_type:complete
MKIKSKSSLWHNIIEQVDEQLSRIPSHDADGTPLEDSIRFDDYKDSLKELKIKTEDNKEINPIHTTLANHLVYDELASRRREGNGK